jgi:hypothetical protein
VRWLVLAALLAGCPRGGATPTPPPEPEAEPAPVEIDWPDAAAPVKADRRTP